MFLLSRLLLGGGALASSGGLSAYFVPQLIHLGENTLFQQSSIDDNIDYEKLNTYSREKLVELNNWVTKLNSSKSFTVKNKEEKHNKLLELMSQIALSEEMLQELYKHIEAKLQSLQKESKTLTDDIQEKLKLDAQFQQIKVFQSALNQLVKNLRQWEEQLQSVICVFKQQGQENGQAQCELKPQTLLSTVLNNGNSSGGGRSVTLLG